MQASIPAERSAVRKVAQCPADRDRLTNETSSLSILAHPGIVMITATETNDEGEVIALETRLIRGPTLAGLSSPPTEVVAGIGAALATTVADIHDLGFFHRRIEASHVLIDEDGMPVLCGFGESGRAGAGEDLAVLRDGDVGALVSLLASMLAGSDPSRVRSTLARARCRRWWSRSVDARSLARQLIKAEPAARLPSPGQVPSPTWRAGAGAGAAGTAGTGDPASRPAGAPLDPDGRSDPASEPVRGRFRSHPVLTVAAAVVLSLVVADATGAFGSSSNTHTDGSRRPIAVRCPSTDDGCRPLSLSNGSITLDHTRFALEDAGWPGLVVVGRWSCSGTGLPAALDLSTGRVWVFPRWPTPRVTTTARLLMTVPGAYGLEVGPSRSGCDELEISRPGRPPVRIQPGLR